MRVKIYTDGASRNNPGQSGIGIVIMDGNNKIVAQKAEYIGIATNNVAEYKAVISGLELAKNIGAKEVSLFADSQLLVRQLTGEYRVKNEGLQPLYRSVKALINEFSVFNAEHIPRTENLIADKLANSAIDEYLCLSRGE